MQLYAIDENNNLVSARESKKQRDYRCMECGGIIRLRSGIHRQSHFFHIHPPASCRQNGKSMEHLQTQRVIKELLGDACLLEVPFPKVKRIADCVWTSENIIFEVQCSSISQEEVECRNKDYAACGYQVVWILHDRRFNQFRPTSAEFWLQNHPHYFTNMNAEGKGCIYDQYSFFQGGIRKLILHSSPILLNKRYLSLPHPLPKQFQERMSKWEMGFEGDWAHRAADELEWMIGMLPKDEQLPRPKIIKRLLHAMFVYPYRVIFAYWLEKACR